MDWDDPDGHEYHGEMSQSMARSFDHWRCPSCHAQVDVRWWSRAIRREAMLSGVVAAVASSVLLLLGGYWLGLFSATQTIENVNQEIGQLNSTISGGHFETTIGSLRQDIEQLTINNGQFESKIDSLRQEIGRLTRSVNQAQVPASPVRSADRVSLGFECVDQATREVVPGCAIDLTVLSETVQSGGTAPVPIQVQLELRVVAKRDGYREKVVEHRHTETGQMQTLRIEMDLAT
jgi:hypothetical protein